MCLIALAGCTPPQAAWQEPGQGQARVVEVELVERALSVEPHDVAYRDHLIAARFVVRRRGGREVLAYLQSMRDNQLTEAASLRVGQRVTLSLTPWSEVARFKGTINRSELPKGVPSDARWFWGDVVSQP